MGDKEANFQRPSIVLTDNWPQFDPKLLDLLCKELDVRTIAATECQWQTNGQVERFNTAIISGLTHGMAKHKKEEETFLISLTCAYSIQVPLNYRVDPFSLRSLDYRLDVLFYLVQIRQTSARLIEPSLSYYVWLTEQPYWETLRIKLPRRRRHYTRLPTVARPIRITLWSGRPSNCWRPSANGIYCRYYFLQRIFEAAGLPHMAIPGYQCWAHLNKDQSRWYREHRIDQFANCCGHRRNA